MTDNYYREPKGSTEATQVMASDDVRAAQQAAAQAEANDAAARRAQERADRDRALGRVPVGTPTAVLLYDDEVGVEVPSEPHDRRVLAAITPTRVVRLRV